MSKQYCTWQTQLIYYIGPYSPRKVRTGHIVGITCPTELMIPVIGSPSVVANCGIIVPSHCTTLICEYCIGALTISNYKSLIWVGLMFCGGTNSINQLCTSYLMLPLLWHYPLGHHSTLLRPSTYLRRNSLYCCWCNCSPVVIAGHFLRHCGLQKRPPLLILCLGSSRMVPPCTYSLQTWETGMEWSRLHFDQKTNIHCCWPEHVQR